MNEQFAWHFVGNKLRDGRPVPADGVTLEHTGPMVICKSGLHYSYDAFDALTYAPGDILCYVKVEELGEQHIDKGVCRKRTIIKRKDITQLLRRFACDRALDVIHLWNAPEVVRQYLRTTKESIRAAALDAARVDARDDAWDAARDAARGAARNAAWDAAWAAAWGAARAAAWDAAWTAAWGAAWAAAWGAARDYARGEFNRLVHKEFNLY